MRKHGRKNRMLACILAAMMALPFSGFAEDAIPLLDGAQKDASRPAEALGVIPEIEYGALPDASSTENEALDGTPADGNTDTSSDAAGLPPVFEGLLPVQEALILTFTGPETVLQVGESCELVVDILPLYELYGWVVFQSGETEIPVPVEDGKATLIFTPETAGIYTIAAWYACAEGEDFLCNEPRYTVYFANELYDELVSADILAVGDAVTGDAIEEAFAEPGEFALATADTETVNTMDILGLGRASTGAEIVESPAFSLEISPSSISYGKTATITVRQSYPVSNAMQASGEFTLACNGIDLGAVRLGEPFVYTPASAGVFLFAASYPGDEYLLAGDAQPSYLTVNKAAPEFALDMPEEIAYGETFSVTVRQTSELPVQEGDTLTLSYDGQEPVNVLPGEAVSFMASAAGSRELLLSYGGNADLGGVEEIYSLKVARATVAIEASVGKDLSTGKASFSAVYSCPDGIAPSTDAALWTIGGVPASSANPLSKSVFWAGVDVSGGGAFSVLFAGDENFHSAVSQEVVVADLSQIEPFETFAVIPQSGVSGYGQPFSVQIGLAEHSCPPGSMVGVDVNGGQLATLESSTASLYRGGDYNGFYLSGGDHTFTAWLDAAGKNARHTSQTAAVSVSPAALKGTAAVESLEYGEMPVVQVAFEKAANVDAVQYPSGTVSAAVGGKTTSAQLENGKAVLAVDTVLPVGDAAVGGIAFAPADGNYAADTTGVSVDAFAVTKAATVMECLGIADNGNGKVGIEVSVSRQNGENLATGAVMPAGEVSLVSGEDVLCTAKLGADGHAAMLVSIEAIDGKDITAVFAEDERYFACSTEVPTLARPIESITLSANPQGADGKVLFGQDIELAVTVVFAKGTDLSAAVEQLKQGLEVREAAGYVLDFVSSEVEGSTAVLRYTYPMKAPQTKGKKTFTAACSAPVEIGGQKNARSLAKGNVLVPYASEALVLEAVVLKPEVSFALFADAIPYGTVPSADVQVKTADLGPVQEGAVALLANGNASGEAAGLNAEGMATVTSGAALIPGKHSLSVSYTNETEGYRSAQSAAIRLIVEKAPARVTTPEVTGQWHSGYTISAKVESGIPSDVLLPDAEMPAGKASLHVSSDGGASYALVSTVSLDAEGIATFEYNAGPLHGKLVKVAYAGNAKYMEAEAETQVNDPLGEVSLEMSPSASSVVIGSVITLTAKVSEGMMNFGEVVFLENGEDIAQPVTIDGNTVSVTFAPDLGSHAYTVAYRPKSGGMYTNQQPLRLNVHKAAPAISASASQSATGGAHLLAVVASSNDLPAPTGQVVFLYGDMVLGTVDLVDGTASMTWASAPLGLVAIKAVYQGDTLYDSIGYSTATTIYAVSGEGATVYPPTFWPWPVYTDSDQEKGSGSSNDADSTKGKNEDALADAKNDEDEAGLVGTLSTSSGTAVAQMTGDSATLTIQDSAIPLAGLMRADGVTTVRLLDEDSGLLEQFDASIDGEKGGVLSLMATPELTQYTFEFSTLEMRTFAAEYPEGYYEVETRNGVHARIPFGLYEGFPELAEYLAERELHPDTLRLRITFKEMNNITAQAAVEAELPGAQIITPLWRVRFTLHDIYGTLLDYELNEKAEMETPLELRFEAESKVPYSVVFSAKDGTVELPSAERDEAADGQVIVKVARGADYAVAKKGRQGAPADLAEGDTWMWFAVSP